MTMGFVANQLNYMHIGSFFTSKITQSAGITAIILKQWDAPWYLYIILPIAVVIIFNVIGWIAVITKIWEGYMKEQFKGSLLK